MPTSAAANAGDPRNAMRGAGFSSGGLVGGLEGGGGGGRERYGVVTPRKKRPPTETIFTPEGEIQQPLGRPANIAPAVAAPAAAALASPLSAAPAAGPTSRAAPLDWLNLATVTPRRAYQATSAPLADRRTAARTVASGYGF